MSLISLEVDIDDGHVTAKEPGLLPKRGRGILTVLSTEPELTKPSARVALPLIPASGQVINPTKEELDASVRF